MKKPTFCALTLTLCMAGSSAFAAFDLQITEMWPGNEPGDNQTDDWFEVTNLGDMAWTAAVDGDLYFDDDSADTVAADLMSGIASIAPGESVVFVDGSAAVGGFNVLLWSSVWAPDLASLPQIGTYEGSGLSQGGDGVTLFLDAGMDGVDAGDQIDLELYPDMDLFGGRTYDSNLGAVSFGPQMTKTTDLNDAGQPSIGSPGYLPTALPEPSGFVLAGMGIALMARRRR